jgi:uncharacterized surface protein with fasciclin (FAS1) repeats
LTSAETVLGQPLSISSDGNTVKVNDANVIITDIEGSNGVIHVIDAVIVPADESSVAVACAQDYVVQADDWLSKIAAKFYGDPLAYAAIVEATNAAGTPYDAIEDPDVIEVGQVLCIPEEAHGGMAEVKSDTIVDIAVADGRFTTLVTALQAAELVETLQGEGPFTVFAPTDEAFAKLPEGTLDALLADKAALTDVLLYHVVAGEVPAADVVSLSSADTLLGQPVSISVSGDTVQVGDAQVIVTDIKTSNGIIHVIDPVLIPEGQ